MVAILFLVAAKARSKPVFISISFLLGLYVMQIMYSVFFAPFVELTIAYSFDK